VRANIKPAGRTHQGGVAYARDAKSELFITAVSNLVGQDSMYETAEAHDLRYRNLVWKVAKEDPWFVAELAAWLRTGANLRTVALVTAAELAAATKGEHPRELRSYGDQWQLGPVRFAVQGAIQRPDEPGELIAYWKQAYPNTQLPKGLKRGIAARITQLYTERNALKWDGDKSSVRFADALELTHPRPRASAWQGNLFKHLIDMRHHRVVEVEDLWNQQLEMLHSNHALRWMAANREPLELLNEAAVKAAGMTWEDVLSLGGQHGLDKRELWEAIIPSMGYMALLRNLRNISKAGVSAGVMDAIARQLQDPAEVSRSRQLPMRFLSAHRATLGDPQWELAIGRALDHSLANVPALGGRTLVLIDTSGSMADQLSARSDLKRWDAAVVFGLALANRANDATVVSFSTDTRVFHSRQREPLLRQVERWKNEGFFIGSGTDTIGAVEKHWDGTHDRLVIVTDEQVNTRGYSWGWRNRRGNGSETDRLDQVVSYATPTYTWNLAGYSPAHLPSGGEAHNWHAFGGLNDGAFKLISLLEAGTDAGWPWEMEEEEINHDA
jgi:hypothetical protein